MQKCHSPANSTNRAIRPVWPSPKCLLCIGILVKFLKNTYHVCYVNLTAAIDRLHTTPVMVAKHVTQPKPFLSNTCISYGETIDGHRKWSIKLLFPHRNFLFWVHVNNKHQYVILTRKKETCCLFSPVNRDERLPVIIAQWVDHIREETTWIFFISGWDGWHHM